MNFDRATRAVAAYSIAFKVALAIAMILTIVRFTALHGEIVEDERRAALALEQRDRVRQMINEETGMRGYVATGDPQFLDIFYKSRKRAHVGDATERAVQDYLDREIALVHERRRAQAIRELRRGKALFDRFRREEAPIQRMREGALFGSFARTARLADGIVRIAIVAIVLILLAIAASAFTYWRLHVAQRLSRSDPLTDLPNRRHAIERIEAWLDEPRAAVGVIFLDLDGFKKINDVHGHAAGDGILRMVAERLRAQVWEGDVVARIGGDEFLCAFGPHIAADALQRIAQRLHHAITRPYRFEDQDYVLGCSCGWTVSEAGSHDARALMDWADRAMYQAKAAGGGIRSASVQQAFSTGG